MQKEQQPGTGWRPPTLSAKQNLAVAESAYAMSRVAMRRATGFILEKHGIFIADAQTGVVEASHP